MTKFRSELSGFFLEDGFWQQDAAIMLTEMRSTSAIRPYENNPHLNAAAVDSVASGNR